MSLSPKNRSFSDFIYEIVDMIDYIIPPIVLLTTIVFMYGIVIYIFRSGDENKRKDGIRYMLYGIIGLTIMVSVWGIVRLLSYSLFGDYLLIPQF